MLTFINFHRLRYGGGFLFHECAMMGHAPCKMLLKDLYNLYIFKVVLAVAVVSSAIMNAGVEVIAR